MKNKRRLVIPTIIVAVTAIIIGLIIFGVMRKGTETVEQQSSDALPDKIGSDAITTETNYDTVPPITQDTADRETVEEKADIELDIGKIERDTDPELIDTKIEYGTKEGKEDE